MVSTKNSNKLLDAIISCQDSVKAFISKKVPFSELEDIFQEIVCNLIKADSLNGPVNMVSAWLFKAAKNEVIDRYRKKKETLFWDGGGEQISRELTEISEILQSQPETPEDSYLRQLFWEELDLALEQLPEDQMEVFIQTELLGKSFKDLSDETDVPVNTLLSRKHKAVLSLRKKLLELYELIVQG
ncbi:MAG: sigma-70 family RNA polymerase sigma factor [Deltaproteobacteria bacterium]|nr:sigma-70 family RNA polymerase sigma factor [Deltaproteobacteria bacterium]